jgi:hypothetical protein
MATDQEQSKRSIAKQLSSWLNFISQPKQSPICFTSLGMVVLDELNFTTESFTDVLSGSGTYGKITQQSQSCFIDPIALGTIGARIFRPFPNSKSVGWMIRAGHDFPPSVKTLLESWKCTLFVTEEMDKLSTRGRLTYKDELGSNIESSFSGAPLIKKQPSPLNILLRPCRLPPVT